MELSHVLLGNEVLQHKMSYKFSIKTWTFTS